MKIHASWPDGARASDQAFMRDPGSTAASRNALGSPSFSRIRIEHLTIGYQTQGTELRVMEDVSFDIQRGEILCIVGPSGCGKSSILNTLSGFIAPVSGRVSVEGSEGGLAALRRGVVFQEYALFPWRTARRNVEFGLQVRGLSALRSSLLGFCSAICSPAWRACWSASPSAPSSA
jgi:ABC-type multidrug transport system fused ATPase/permease subunit